MSSACFSAAGCIESAVESAREECARERLEYVYVSHQYEAARYFSAVSYRCVVPTPRAEVPRSKVVPGARRPLGVKEEQLPVQGRCTAEDLAQLRVGGLSESAISAACTP